MNPVIMMLYTKYAMKLHLSAKEPETRVAAVAAKTNWKNHFDNLYAEMQYYMLKCFLLSFVIFGSISDFTTSDSKIEVHFKFCLLNTLKLI